MGVTVYPTGTTIYKPEKCWNGYTLFQVNSKGALLIDMNGREVHFWEGVDGHPNKMLPDGSILTNVKLGGMDSMFGRQTVGQVDWDGNVVWSFKDAVEAKRPDGTTYMTANQHHDIQRTGNPVGYYVPGMEALTDSGNTLVLSSQAIYNEDVSKRMLNDDLMVEVTHSGEVVWRWLPSEHIDEMGFDEEERAAIYNFGGDWLHINSMSTLGPNKWFDAGDERFHPDNIIVDSRGANISFIIDKATGKIVWQIGPKYDQPPLNKIGWIIGQHHVHMIPRGLPGEGNILIFDNGSEAGYGKPTLDHPGGYSLYNRSSSRILEIDPVTLELVWDYSNNPHPEATYNLYSPNVSLAQRLPNGNTMICEGLQGRFLEVTPDKEIVWEYLSPYVDLQNIRPQDILYRAYRVPYEWAPIAEKPVETPVAQLVNKDFRVPGAAPCGGAETVKLKLNGEEVEIVEVDMGGMMGPGPQGMSGSPGEMPPM